jgi:DNA primase
MKDLINSEKSPSISIDDISDERIKTLFTELTVEPIRSDGEVSARYIESIVARLREVGISRAIADLKSNLLPCVTMLVSAQSFTQPYRL